MSLADIADQPHWLYQFLAADGTHLYVGITANLGQRFVNHYRKPWWGDVARIEVDLHPTRGAALEAEAARIALYNPPHNLNLTDRANSRGWSGRLENIEAWHAAGKWCRDSLCADCTAAAHAAQVSCFRPFHCPACLDFIPYRYALDEPLEADCWRELERRHGGEGANRLLWETTSASAALKIDDGDPVVPLVDDIADRRAYALALARASAAIDA